MADAKPPPIAPWVGVALSLVTSLVIAGVQWGASNARAEADRETVRKLEARVDSGALATQAQALELAGMKSDVRSIKESVGRIERAVESLAPSRTAQRGGP